MGIYKAHTFRTTLDDTITQTTHCTANLSYLISLIQLSAKTLSEHVVRKPYFREQVRNVISLYRSILRLAVFGKFGDATRPDDHTSPRAHARSSAAASPHPDAVLTRLAAQRSNVLELHSALTTADGHTARRSKLVEHGGARSWE